MEYKKEQEKGKKRWEPRRTLKKEEKKKEQMQRGKSNKRQKKRSWEPKADPNQGSRSEEGFGANGERPCDFDDEDNEFECCRCSETERER